MQVWESTSSVCTERFECLGRIDARYITLLPTLAKIIANICVYIYCKYE